MTDKIYYKMRMSPDEGGLMIITEKWLSIHETPCFHYCIPEYNKGFLTYAKFNFKGTFLQAAKKNGIPVKRIAKHGSRFAFDTEEKAFKHLRFLKRRQLNHMKRDIKFIDHFLSITATDNSLDTLKKSDHWPTVPGSKDLVNEHYVFD